MFIVKKTHPLAPTHKTGHRILWHADSLLGITHFMNHGQIAVYYDLFT
jgi:hypothetical protein